MKNRKRRTPKGDDGYKTEMLQVKARCTIIEKNEEEYIFETLSNLGKNKSEILIESIKELGKTYGIKYQGQ